MRSFTCSSYRVIHERMLNTATDLGHKITCVKAQETVIMADKV